MAALVRAVAAMIALGALAGPSLAGDRSDAGVDADDARTEAILGAHGPAPAGRRDAGRAMRPARRTPHGRKGRAHEPRGEAKAR